MWHKLFKMWYTDNRLESGYKLNRTVVLDMMNSMYLLTPEDKNFISHVVRNYQTFHLWVSGTDHPQDFDLNKARLTSAEYMLSTMARAHGIRLEAPKQLARILANGSLAAESAQSINILAVVKELADLLDGYAAQLS